MYITTEKIDKMIQLEVNKHIEEIEKVFDSDVFFYIGGFSRMTASHYFINQIKKIKDRGRNKDTLTIILTTDGGETKAVYEILEEIRVFIGYPNINVVVPRKAFSAGTLFCFGANQLYMGNGSNLGVIDVQIPTHTGEWVSTWAILQDYNELVERQNGKGKSLTKFEENLFLVNGQYSRNYITWVQLTQNEVLNMALDYLTKYRFGYEIGSEEYNKLKGIVESLCYPYTKHERIKTIYSHTEKLYIRDLIAINIVPIRYNDEAEQSFKASNDIEQLYCLLNEYMALNRHNTIVAGTGINLFSDKLQESGESRIVAYNSVVTYNPRYEPIMISNNTPTKIIKESQRLVNSPYPQ